MTNEIKPSAGLKDVRYETRGQLAHDMDREGYEFISLNNGNPGLS